MNETPRSVSGWKLLSVFFGLFTPVFLLCVLTATLITFILPETYVSIARIKIEPPAAGSSSAQGGPNPYFVQTEFAVIQSEAVLDQVIKDLGLNEVWGKKFGTGEKLRTVESLGLLKGRLELRPIVNTSLIEIRIYSEDRDEAATLANKIADVYIARTKMKNGGVPAELIDSAHPGFRPVRPNKPLNIALGVIFGGLLGALAGGIGAALVQASSKKGRSASVTTNPPA